MKRYWLPISNGCLIVRVNLAVRCVKSLRYSCKNWWRVGIVSALEGASRLGERLRWSRRVQEATVSAGILFSFLTIFGHEPVNANKEHSPLNLFLRRLISRHPQLLRLRSFNCIQKNMKSLWIDTGTGKQKYSEKPALLRLNRPGFLSRYRDSLRAGRFGDRITMGARLSATVQTCPEAHTVSCKGHSRV
jgi:hypothetical protein